jgi:hypothetical protein
MVPVFLRLCAAIWICQEAEQNTQEFVEDLTRLRSLDGTIAGLTHVPAIGSTLVMNTSFGKISCRVITIRTESAINALTGNEPPTVYLIPEDHF